MTLQVFVTPITKHKLTKSEFQQERYPSSGSTQKEINRKNQGQKPKIEATMPIKKVKASYHQKYPKQINVEK